MAPTGPMCNGLNPCGPATLCGLLSFFVQQLQHRQPHQDQPTCDACGSLVALHAARVVGACRAAVSGLIGISAVLRGAIGLIAINFFDSCQRLMVLDYRHFSGPIILVLTTGTGSHITALAPQPWQAHDGWRRRRPERLHTARCSHEAAALLPPFQGFGKEYAMRYAKHSHTVSARSARAVPRLVCACVLLASVVQAAAQDPIQTDGDKYKVQLENDCVRVLDYRDQPGEVTRQHDHPAFVLYALAPFERTLTLAGGKVLRRTFATGDVMWSPAQTHIGKNSGTTPTHALLVEIKPAPAQDCGPR